MSGPSWRATWLTGDAYKLIGSAKATRPLRFPVEVARSRCASGSPGLFSKTARGPPRLQPVDYRGTSTV